MRSAGNFHPEWGYLAPAPSFMRTARIVLVATAVGATAGAGVVVSLGQHSSDAVNSSLAAHVLITNVQATPNVPAPAATTVAATPVQTQTPPVAMRAPPQAGPTPGEGAVPAPKSVAAIQTWTIGASQRSTASQPAKPATLAAIETIPTSEAVMLPNGDDAAPADAALAAPKKTVKKHRAVRYASPGRQADGDPRRGWPGGYRLGGPLQLPLFSYRGGGAYYAN